MQEDFDAAIQAEKDSGKEESSINQESVWDDIATGSRNRKVGKGNLVRSLDSDHYKPHLGSSSH